MAQRKNKGGAPSLNTKEKHTKLQALGLFNRTSSIYATMESTLNILPPAKAFDLFRHYCAKRDMSDSHTILGHKYHTPYEKKRYQSMLKEQIKFIENIRLCSEDIDDALYNSLMEILKLSEKIFFYYSEIIIREFVKKTNHSAKSNNFVFSSKKTLEWRYIERYYSEEKQEEIYNYMIESNIQQSEELADLYNKCTDVTTLKAMHKLFLLDNYKVPYDDVFNNMDSLFYLTPEERSSLDTVLYRDRYKEMHIDIREQSPHNYGVISSSKPRLTFHFDIDKPEDYISESFVALQKYASEELHIPSLIIEEKDRRQLQKLRQDIMRYQKSEKTLAQKLTDMLYIYDMKKMGFSNPFIADSISSYYNRLRKRGQTQKWTSYSTLYNYYKLTQSMIDQKNYRNY